MSAAQLQTLLRFLAQDAKVPLAIAIAKVKELQQQELATPELLAAAKAAALIPIFQDEKIAKQVIAAAKRVCKKRKSKNEEDEEESEKLPPTPKKKVKNESLFSNDGADEAFDLEESLCLPSSDAGEQELKNVVLFSNRAPLVLAFVVTLLKYTMPDQPLSSRLSLAQAYVSTTSRTRAVHLGIESGKSAEEEGYGEGQPSVTIMGKQLRILRRWDYQWRRAETRTSAEQASIAIKKEDIKQEDGAAVEAPDAVAGEEPALWGMDLEALKKSNTLAQSTSSKRNAGQTHLPIYTPQSARAYLFKSFDSASVSSDGEKKVSSLTKTAEKERNLGHLLCSLDLLYGSWKETLSAQELDSRTWGWYVRVRPSVEDGVAGWGGKNQIRLADILALRR